MTVEKVENLPSSGETSPVSSISIAGKESFGEYLKREREMRGITLEEIAEITKISKSNLEAIEGDDYKRLPPPIYVQGFLKAYASHLGLDSNDVLLRYQMYLAGLEETEEDLRTRRRKTFRWSVPIISAILMLLIVAFVLYYKKGDKSIKDYDVAIKIKPVLEHPGAPVSEKTTIVALPKPAKKEGPFTLVAICKEMTWIRIKTDNELPKEYLLRPGDRVKWKEKRQFRLRIGNAAGLELTLNNEPLGTLGNAGEVIDLTLP